jgi:hypothetical protein
MERVRVPSRTRLRRVLTLPLAKLIAGTRNFLSLRMRTNDRHPQVIPKCRKARNCPMSVAPITHNTPSLPAQGSMSDSSWSRQMIDSPNSGHELEKDVVALVVLLVA